MRRAIFLLAAIAYVLVSVWEMRRFNATDGYLLLLLERND